MTWRDDVKLLGRNVSLPNGRVAIEALDRLAAELEHLEEGCGLLVESSGGVEVIWPRLVAWLEAERARKERDGK